MTAMKRVSDGAIMPYSKTLVAAKPGEYVEMAWDAKSGKWTEKNGVPLVAVPKPAETGTIPDDADDEERKADYVDPEPETGVVEPEASAATGKRRRGQRK